MASTVGWAKLMYIGINSGDVDEMPSYNKGRTKALYFILFIVVGAFFILNLFVGVVISTYNREKETFGQNFLLTD